MKLFTAPPQYALWWELTKSCSGLGRDVSGVRFYSEPADKLQPADAAAAGIAGEWNATTNSITLSDAALESGSVVRHEMLHALIVASGHPANLFADDCAGYVNCEGSCREAAGTTTEVPAEALRVETSDVQLSQRLVPSEIDLSADPEGWFALVVEVHNPHEYAVQVHLKPFPGRDDTAALLGYAGLRTSHQEYTEGAQLPMLPGETRRVVYDLRARDFIAENGSPRIRGFFNADSLPVLTLKFAGQKD